MIIGLDRDGEHRPGPQRFFKDLPAPGQGLRSQVIARQGEKIERDEAHGRPLSGHEPPLQRFKVRCHDLPVNDAGGRQFL